MQLGKGARFGAARGAAAVTAPAPLGGISNFFGVKGAQARAYAEGAGWASVRAPSRGETPMSISHRPFLRQG
jgi:hypothetical protein